MARTPERVANSAVSAVSFQVGQLTDDESALVHGAFYARALAEPDAPVSGEQVKQVAAVLRKLREEPCPWCGKGLNGHTFEVTSYYPHVWCTEQQRSRTPEEWLGPRGMESSRNPLLAVLLWIGLPLFSCGLLAWLAPTIATIRQRDRTWTTGAIVLGGMTIMTFVLSTLGGPESLLYNIAIAVNFVAWIGGTIFGGFQMRHWLAT